MFSARLINSAKFLKMPISSQALYFHLGLHADDDGVVEAYPVIKTVGCTEDDLKVLVAKGFVQVLNEDLVAYITDWQENNQIRPDRKIDSIYKDLLIQMNPDVKLVEKRERADRRIPEIVDVGQSMDSHGTDMGQPEDGHGTVMGQSMDGIGKYSIGEDRIDKDREGENRKEQDRKEEAVLSQNDDFLINRRQRLREDFDKLWKLYPSDRRNGSKNKAFDAYVDSIEKGADHADILIGLNKFVAYTNTQMKGDERRYIPYPEKFFKEERWNRDYTIKDKNNFNNFEQHDYDWDQLERDLLGYDT